MGVSKWDVRAGPMVPATADCPPRAGAPADSGSGQPGDAVELAHVVAMRLFSVGLDLNFALMVLHDGPAASRLRHGIDELDGAIRDLRRLVLAVPGLAAGAAPDGGSPGR